MVDDEGFEPLTSALRTQRKMAIFQWFGGHVSHLVSHGKKLHAHFFCYIYDSRDIRMCINIRC